MSVSKFNSEGYYDPTTYEALTNIEAEERKARFRPLVFICSPFSGNEQTNIENARRYCRFAIDRGYAPFAPHLFFPQFMDDAVPEERENGIFMGIIMLTKCAELWVFARSPGGGDRISKGMAQEIRKAESRSIPIRYFTTDCEEVEV